MSVKKVLSIDIDYLMSPCINLYNDCIGSDEFQHGNLWDKLNQLRGIDKHLAYDERSLVELTSLFCNQLRHVPKENIFFAEEHDMILEQLSKIKGEKFDIYNVDHHHDIYYNPQQKSEVDRFDFACLANWVYYLGKNDKINKYYWVRNENSARFSDAERIELTFPFDDETYCQDLIKLDHDVIFDYIFVCRSNDYLPKKCDYLFDLFYRMACSTKNYNFFVWDKPYCVDGKSRPLPRE